MFTVNKMAAFMPATAEKNTRAGFVSLAKAFENEFHCPLPIAHCQLFRRGNNWQCAIGKGQCPFAN
jgi:hypothetical protein